jgi:hypothetical protein
VHYVVIAFLLGIAQARSISLEEMTMRADVILTGKCIASRARWDDKSKIVMTESTFAVDRYLKGKATGTITVTSVGGALPDRNIMMTIPGMVEFTPEEDVLLFLAKSPDRTYSVYGQSQGKFVIKTDAKTGRRIVGQESLTTFVSKLERISRGQKTK